MNSKCTCLGRNVASICTAETALTLRSSSRRSLLLMAVRRSPLSAHRSTARCPVLLAAHLAVLLEEGARGVGRSPTAADTPRALQDEKRCECECECEVSARWPSPRCDNAILITDSSGQRLDNAACGAGGERTRAPTPSTVRVSPPPPPPPPLLPRRSSHHAHHSADRIHEIKPPNEKKNLADRPNGKDPSPSLLVAEARKAQGAQCRAGQCSVAVAAAQLIPRTARRPHDILF
ncbi:hypothetical protein RR46_02162 [Papilio xuthus]|uniref:Uncharacterized protein n=1 Tax=Papilio xuthus TaxID=66420 RepID=A0A194QPW6_PAPXU|nr:hypothetical protein RR46_02162 [Papilio xuthus]